MSILGKPKSSHFTLTENSELALVCQVRTNIHKKVTNYSFYSIPGKWGACPQSLLGQGGGASAWWSREGTGWPAHLLCCDQGSPGDICLLRDHRHWSQRQGLSHCQSQLWVLQIFSSYFMNFSKIISILTWAWCSEKHELGGGGCTLFYLFILDHDRELDKIISRRLWKVIPRMSCHVRRLLMSRTQYIIIGMRNNFSNKSTSHWVNAASSKYLEEVIYGGFTHPNFSSSVLVR